MISQRREPPNGVTWIYIGLALLFVSVCFLAKGC